MTPFQSFAAKLQAKYEVVGCACGCATAASARLGARKHRLASLVSKRTRATATKADDQLEQDLSSDDLAPAQDD